MNKELMGALDELEREKNISKETLLDAVEIPMDLTMAAGARSRSKSAFRSDAGASGSRSRR